VRRLNCHPSGSAFANKSLPLCGTRWPSVYSSQKMQKYLFFVVSSHLGKYFKVDARHRDLAFSNDFNRGPGREHPRAREKVCLCVSVWRGVDEATVHPAIRWTSPRNRTKTGFSRLESQPRTGKTSGYSGSPLFCLMYALLLGGWGTKCTIFLLDTEHRAVYSRDEGLPVS